MGGNLESLNKITITEMGNQRGNNIEKIDQRNINGKTSTRAINW